MYCVSHLYRLCVFSTCVAFMHCIFYVHHNTFYFPQILRCLQGIKQERKKERKKQANKEEEKGKLQEISFMTLHNFHHQRRYHIIPVCKRACILAHARTAHCGLSQKMTGRGSPLSLMSRPTTQSAKRTKLTELRRAFQFKLSKRPGSSLLSLPQSHNTANHVHAEL